MKCAFITDLHIDFDCKNTMGKNTQKQFEAVLDSVAKRAFDMIILGGDLCNKTGDVDIYKYIRSKLTPLDIPNHIIAGNHDDSELLANSFGLEDRLSDSELYYTIKSHDADLIFLDSSRGLISSKQWEWLDSSIGQQNHSEIQIIMHHPPILCGSMHMEPRYFFTQSDNFLALAQKFSKKKINVYCGHYHLEKVVHHKNISVYISPSTYLQINPDTDHFSEGIPYFGYREMVFSAHHLVHTNVCFL